MNQVLRLDENAESIIPIEKGAKGIVVIENKNESATVIAINYSLSIGADIEIIEAPEIEIRQVENIIESWKDGNINSLNELSAYVYPKIEKVEFINYEFSTFFTYCIPYSLLLQNIIPITHVNLGLYPDIFIFNNIYFEENEQLSSSIVFSPLEFSDEETDFVIDKLEKNNFYVKKLIGKQASAYNLDKYIKDYPFDLLHVCSHGGEVDGYNVTETFKDRNGNSHTVEFDEVLSFHPNKRDETVKVATKMLFRKLDGFEWKSPELKAQNYPHYVYSDMLNEIHKNKDKIRNIKKRIYGSCSIKCSDFAYQAMFNSLAAYHSPVIFNNTCWSWSRISDSFLAVGARCYIGTLWNIDNINAKKTAEIFYEKVTAEPIIIALYKAFNPLYNTKDENIYLIWGLHFSTLKNGVTIYDSKVSVAKKLLLSLSIWQDKLNDTKSKSAKKNIQEIIEWIAETITQYFKVEAMNLMRKREK